MKLTTKQLKNLIRETFESSESFKEQVFDAFERLIGGAGELNSAEAAEIIADDLGVDMNAVYDVLLKDEEEFLKSLGENRQLKEANTASNYAFVDGSGDWTNKKITKPIKVKIVDLEVGEEELRVYFDPSSWDIRKLGLIYQDKRFLKDVQNIMKKQYPSIKWVGYSEHGMQGVDYVSFDIYETPPESVKSQQLGEGKLDFTFEELYDRLVDTLIELEDRHNQDPERISRQACRTIERIKKDEENLPNVPVTTFPRRRSSGDVPKK